MRTVLKPLDLRSSRYVLQSASVISVGASHPVSPWIRKGTPFWSSSDRWSAETRRGKAGAAAAGVTCADGADAGPVPMAFVAVTENEYPVPEASPVKVALVEDAKTVAL